MVELPDGSEVRICGIVSAFKEITTKKGDRMGFVTIEDLTGSVEITVFSDIYATTSTLLKSDDPLLVVGKLEKGEKGCKVLIMKGGEENNGKRFQRDRGPAGDIKLLSEARSQTTKKVYSSSCVWRVHPSKHLDPLKGDHRTSPGHCAGLSPVPDSGTESFHHAACQPK